MFRPKGPSSYSAYWPNVVVFGCTLILIHFGISGSVFSMYLTPFEYVVYVNLIRFDAGISKHCAAPRGLFLD